MRAGVYRADTWVKPPVFIGSTFAMDPTTQTRLYIGQAKFNKLPGGLSVSTDGGDTATPPGSGRRSTAPGSKVHLCGSEACARSPISTSLCLPLS